MKCLWIIITIYQKSKSCTMHQKWKAKAEVVCDIKIDITQMASRNVDQIKIDKSAEPTYIIQNS